MAKFAGLIGFGKTEEIPVGSGVHVDVISERKYFCELVKSVRRSDAADDINNNLRMTNNISVVMDSFLNDNLFAIRYVVWRGTRWNTTEVSVEAPRLIIRLGDVYNGPTP